ncbi:hypothetical protein CGMCC3_g15142 [Colletotrichum fructicola]|nr:uncharacterized protein CGMCC3_g15142 [Colletotrichum fructicola]KAE9568724.1 hypothetical protein CGMCC3_g15142 [Colletotrichum fructicola]KAF4890247.1 hypothetical protein CGCFRS4_v008905 [Colletotrichum fructicola]
MSSRNQHTRFQVFADELTGDSRDRPLRYEIENKISIFFDDINEKRWTSVKSYFNDDARVIFGFRCPNQIIDKDVDLVIERIREKTDGMRRVTVPTLVLVDRGRVTCFLTNLWIEIDEEMTTRRWISSRQTRCLEKCTRWLLSTWTTSTNSSVSSSGLRLGRR